ncbi:MAG: hypothetical protein U1E14_14915 [Geminicoccaceae bacterium]
MVKLVKISDDAMKGNLFFFDHQVKQVYNGLVSDFPVPAAVLGPLDLRRNAGLGLDGCDFRVDGWRSFGVYGYPAGHHVCVWAMMAVVAASLAFGGSASVPDNLKALGTANRRI